MAINRYVYISVLKLSNIIDYRYRLSYRKLEKVNQIVEVEHPVVRNVLDYYKIEDPLDINIIADLPASSGLGSSSSFTVGLINLVSKMQDKPMSRLDLGKAAIHVERDLLQERVGVQDQLHAAFGGLNRFDFVNGQFQITPVQMTYQCQRYLMSSLVLIYTGLTRYASEVLKEQIKSTQEMKVDTELSHLYKLTAQAFEILEGEDPERLVKEFGAMMHEGWMTKRKLAKTVSSSQIDELYQAALDAGAIGGKLCGAGSGGFLLMVVPPEVMPVFVEKMNKHHLIDIDIDHHGSIILAT